ncbi:MAG: Rid family detoxifying hydrolase, partial [Bryobacteraceae bacterium]
TTLCGMPDPIRVSVEGLPAANPTYAQAVRIGDVVYVSGQLGIDPATAKLVPGGQVAEYRQALTNLAAVLAAAGSSIKRVVKTTIYMTNIDQLAELNQVYGEFFSEAPPAKTGVEVSRLALKASIEIEAVAVGAGSDAAGL